MLCHSSWSEWLELGTPGAGHGIGERLHETRRRGDQLRIPRAPIGRSMRAETSAALD
jgi:hypothetical protein